MNTADFLAHILPSQGFLFAVKRPATKQYWLHDACATYEELTENVQVADSKFATTFFACASFEKSVIETLKPDGTIKKQYRIGSNAAFVKSLWLDLDCGEGKDYANQKDAITDVVRMAKESGLPRPLFVNSGYGVHCYWVFNRDVAAEQWLKLAAVWRAVVDHFKLRHDSSCTTDICRVLRPVGTHNRKREEPRVVSVVGTVPAPLDPSDFTKSLMALVKSNKIKIKAVELKSKEAPTGLLALNADYALVQEYPPSDINVVAEHCQQVREFKESRGDVAEPFWWAMLGLIKHTVNGEVVCHDWSNGHKDYSFEATQNKIELWTFGPTTCDRLCSINPTSCDGCAHKDKLKSPIQLGGFVEETAPVEEEDVDTGVVEEFSEFPPSMREKYAWVRDQLVTYAKDEDGVKKPLSMCDFLFYPKTFHSMLASNGEMETNSTWVVRMKEGEFKQFVLSGAAAGVGGRELFSVLGKNAIFAKAGAKKHMEQYVSEWFSELRRMGDESRTFHTFGWHGEDFLIGNDLIKPDGTIEKVRLHGDAAKYAVSFENKDREEVWIEAVDKLYNRPNHESYQWLLAGGFGAPLMKLMGGGMAGCIVDGYSADTGLGKSTAGKLALAMYGDPEKLTRTQQQTTSKGLFIFCGIMAHLPVLLDEVTNILPRELSDLAYTFSQGSGRLGAFSDGSLRQNVYEWSTTMLATSNKSFHNLLSVAKADARPEIARVFEYTFTKPDNTLDTTTASVLIAQAQATYGAVGRRYMQYVVANKESVRTLLMKTREMLVTRSASTQDERYWMASAATTITGLLIAKKLGFVRLDVANLVTWVLRQLSQQRVHLRDGQMSMSEHIGNMLNEFSPHFLVTNIDGDARSSEGRAVVLHPPRGSEIKGRVVSTSQTLYLPSTQVRKWCSERQVDYKDLTTYLLVNKLASPEPHPFSLGRGTVDYATSPSRCIKLDLRAMGSQMGEIDAVAKLSVVK